MHVDVIQNALIIQIDRSMAGLSIHDFLVHKLELPVQYVLQMEKQQRLQIHGDAVPLETILQVGKKLWLLGDIMHEQAPWYIKNPHDTFLQSTNLLHILYEDEHILIVNKPAGLLVHPDGVSDVDTLGHRVANYYEQTGQRVRVHHVHRLDKGTSGAILFAKHGYIARALDKQLVERTMRRTYVAVVAGRLPKQSGVIDQPIGRDRHKAGKYRVSTTGKPSCTRYQTIARKNIKQETWTVVSCTLETGRTHQIRVHFSSLGCPIVGDKLYHGPSSPFFSNLSDAFALHAIFVRFYHPYDEKIVEVTAPLPENWFSFLGDLNLKFS